MNEKQLRDFLSLLEYLYDLSSSIETWEKDNAIRNFLYNFKVLEDTLE